MTDYDSVEKKPPFTIDNSKASFNCYSPVFLRDMDIRWFIPTIFLGCFVVPLKDENIN